MKKIVKYIIDLIKEIKNNKLINQNNYFNFNNNNKSERIQIQRNNDNLFNNTQKDNYNLINTNKKFNKFKFTYEDQNNNNINYKRNIDFQDNIKEYNNENDLNSIKKNIII